MTTRPRPPRKPSSHGFYPRDEGAGYAMELHHPEEDTHVVVCGANADGAGPVHLEEAVSIYTFTGLEVEGPTGFLSLTEYLTTLNPMEKS